MQHEGTPNIKRRPRAKTGTSFPNLLKVGRSEPAAATSSPNLSLENLIDAFTPPSPPSMDHARALVNTVQTDTPQLELLTPIISRLCTPHGPTWLLATGFEIISVYAASQAHPLSDVDRTSLFAILRGADPDWTVDTSETRLTALSKLTKDGNAVAGFEKPFLSYTAACASSAFEGLSPEDDSDRALREQFLKGVSRIIRQSLVQNAASYIDQDMHDILDVFANFVRRSLDNVPAGLLSESLSIPSSTTTSTHRRHPSSASSAMFFSTSRPQLPREPTSLSSLLDRTILSISMYISLLDTIQTRLNAAHLPSVVSVLLRIIGVHLSQLPRLSAWPTPQHRPRPAEELALKQFFMLLSGPYCDTVAGHTKRLMASSHPQEALGAFRVVRAVLRDAAESRMALSTIRRQKYDVVEPAPTGQLVISEASVGILHRAHREGVEVPSLTIDRLVKSVRKAVQHWAVRSDADKVLEEALGIVKDVMTEASDRGEEKDDVEDYSTIAVDEGRIVGTILSEAVKYVQRMRIGTTPSQSTDKSPALKIPILPIDKPTMAPTQLLLTLCTQLALPLSTPMVPSLPSILMSIASHLTDTQTATIPQTMYSLGLLTPTSLTWLDNITELFTKLIGRERPTTTREVSRVVEAIHADLTEVPAYRRKLGRCLCELAEQVVSNDSQEDGAAMVGDETWEQLFTNELVCRILESIHGGGTEPDDENGDYVERFIRVLHKHAEGLCPCTSSILEDSYFYQPSSQEATIPSTPGMSLPASSSSSPILSRVSSEVPGQDKDVLPHQQPLNSVLQPVMSMLPGWSMNRSREAGAPPSPAVIRSEVEVSAGGRCRPLNAVIALINTFQELSFAAVPQPAQSVRLFKNLLSVLSMAQCPKVRLAVLQLMMRLRADRDHRLYILSNVDGDVDTLAALVDRSRLTSREMPPDEGDLRRARSMSRNLRRGRGRSSADSRSRSRPGPAAYPAPAPLPKRDPLWVVPESLPFDIPVSEPSSEGVITYESNAPPEWEELKHWLPVSDYVLILVDILRSETDWEILSYVLCHLPVQLANKHFFCGPKTRSAIVDLLVTLCAVTLKGELANSIAEQLPESLRLLDAQGLVFHSLSVLVSYRGIFDRKHHDMLVEAFLAGLNSQPTTVKACLNALSICAYALPSSMTKNLSHIVEKLSRIMTNAEMAVHILDFVSIVGSLPSLYSNFREQEFRMVFAVAVTYIHYHNSPDTRGLSGRESFALSQHVLVVAYYIIYVWFLAVALPDRPNHVQFLARRLLLANEAKGAVDEPTEVCFDWLARYTYATADPKPAYSLLGDIVMNPPRNEDKPEAPLSTKMWLWGNSLVAIRALPKRGWIEVELTRPSGETKFLCKLENFPQVNPGDVDPDMLTDPAIMMMDRDPTEMERNEPDPEDDQARASTSEQATQSVRDIFVSHAEQPKHEARPDPVKGYVWSQSAPSQRRKDVTIDPSFFALQMSQYPHLPKPNAPSQLVPPSPELDRLLRTLKRTPVIDMHKIAILYVAPGQKDEHDILGNRHGSPAYTRFLEGIGRLVRVRDQRDVYTGDIIPETDGEYTYAWWDDIVQVVYHTATLMPNILTGSDFIYKKRHVGNDKVRIVWNDSGLPYRHDIISSAFNFVNLVIEPHSIGTIAAFSNNKHEHEFFKVTMQRMDGMPSFGPIGDYKVVSADDLAPLMRQVSLLADFFCEVYVATDRDTSTDEYVTNWRRRLQYINKFRSRIISEPQPEVIEDSGSLQAEAVRDFTRFF